MNRVLLLLLLLPGLGCKTIKTFQRSVSRLDSTVARISYVRGESTESREHSQGWQEFRLTGFDSLWRLPDLHIESSAVPTVPQFIAGSDRVIYLPTQKIIESRSHLLDSLVLESLRKVSTEKQTEREVVREPVKPWLWVIGGVVAGWLILLGVNFIRNARLR